jgi:hypothetical protein
VGRTVTHHRSRTARHEAGHAAVLVMAGRLPTITADHPDDRAYGRVALDWPDGVDRDGALDVALAVLMGPLVVAEPGWPPQWRPRREVAGDEGQLAACLSYLKLGEPEYYELIRQANTLASSPRFQRLVALIARAAELRDVLTADDLRRLLGAEILRTYAIPKREEEPLNAA